MGSSTHEMFELKRLVQFISEQALPLAPHKSIDIPLEIANLIRDVDEARSHRSGHDFRSTWDKLGQAREHFREKTFSGVSGKWRPIHVTALNHFLTKVLVVLTQAEQKAIDPKTKLPTSYFTYEVDPPVLDHGWRSRLDQLKWKQHRLVPFLEGSVHAMKLLNVSKAKKLFSQVKKSELADKKLGMFKSNVSLKEESPEIGRIRVFAEGWLENESIFLHMHYKFLLEVLRSGLTEEFIKESKKGLIPFRDAKTYGRSIFENSSFLASSAFPKKDFHGKGFVARLSGATSEFLSMIYFMFFGSKIFKELEGSVVFAPEPTLPKECFSRREEIGYPKNSVTLRLFGVPITFVNPSQKNSYGKGRVQPISYEWILEGRFHEHEGRFLTPEASLALRQGRLESLTILLGKGSGKKIYHS